MNWKKMTVTMLMGLGIVGLLAGCGGSGSSSTAELPKKVVVGLDDNFPPMGFRDEAGNLTGFDIELAKEVGKRAGIEMEFKPIDWSSKEAELVSKRVDLLWNGLTITDARKEKIQFTEPYMHNDQIILVRADRSDITDLSSLAGKVVGTQEGGTGIDALAKKPELQKSFKELRLYAVFTDALLDLEIGRVDAVLIDSVVGRYYMTKKPGVFVALQENLATEEYGVGMRKEDTRLGEALNKAIDEIKKDGTGEAISKKWFGTNVMK